MYGYDEKEKLFTYTPDISDDRYMHEGKLGILQNNEINKNIQYRLFVS